MSLPVRLTSVLWGFVLAFVLQYTRWGRWLAIRRSWITVALGIGIDLLILARVLDRRAWWSAAEVIALSSAGIILRALILEYQEGVESLDD